MIHLNKSFLYTDPQKIIPFQTVKTSVGFPTIGKNEAKKSSEILTTRTTTLDVVFPLTASCMALLIETAPADDEDIDQTIVNAKVAPPGTTTVRFTLSGTNQYWIYVISKDLVDGYISTDGNLVSEYDSPAKRLVFTVNSSTQIEPTLQIASPISVQTWYDYNGFYNGPLVWHPPVETDSQGNPAGQYTYLVYFRDMLTDVLDIFDDQFKRPNELSLRTAADADLTAIDDAIRVIGARSKIDRFLRDKVNDPFFSDKEITDYITYVLAHSNQNDADNNVHELIDVYLTNYVYSLVGTSLYTNFYSADNNGRMAYYNGVRAKVRDTTTQSLHARIYEEAINVYGYRLGQTNDAFTNIVLGFQVWTADALDGALLLHQSVTTSHNQTSSRLSVLDWTIDGTFSYDNLITRVNTVSSDFYNNVYTYTKQQLTEVDSLIKALGDPMFITGGTSGNTGSTAIRLAQEAILQNIRYIKDLIRNSTADVWSSNVNLDSLILKTLNKILKSTETSTDITNSLVNISSSYVNPEEMDILYTDDLTNSEWKPFDGQLLSLADNVKAIDASSLTKPGKYAFLIRPKRIEIGITEIPGLAVISTPDLNDYQAENYFYGWNIEFSQVGSHGQRLGDIRVITSSYFIVNDHRLKISPSIDGVVDFAKNVKASIWANSFIPVLVDVELTEHNFQTLSYAPYAAKEFDVDNGILTLYDYSGKIYKQWTIGRRVLESEGYREIEFRYPIISGA